MLNDLVTEFQAKWYDAIMLCGARPSLQSFLARVEAADAAALAARLIPIDVDQRLIEEDQVQASDYAQYGDTAVDIAASSLEKTRDFGPPLRPGSGDLVGERYVLRELLGQGGMGEVWLADQIEPIRREVAIKVIRARLGSTISKDEYARFELERQSLALMNHENIAKVLDGGTTSDRKPYFVMELVKGVPITQYCDEVKQSLEGRIQLLISVCNAVQHAHHKGVIHRDIKPSNVLITIVDGKPVAKVIDFGLAKVSNHQALTKLTLRTQYGQLLGTLQYMSPEQAEPSPLDIDTRSDIYSLGILLYEILTGSTPLKRETLEKQPLVQILREIRENEPQRPSERLAESGDRLNLISAQRRIEPERLKRVLAGELDWIVLKALEKDRLRRYSSASGLAADLQRFLDDEPVIARPPSFAYRMHKTIRRHKLAFGFAVSLLLILLTSTIGISALAVWALKERDRALLASGERNVALKKANRSLAQNKQLNAKLKKETKSTSDLLDVMLDGNDVFFDNVMAEPQLKSPRLQKTRSNFLVGIQKYYESIVASLMKEQRDDDAHLERLASAYQKIGKAAAELGNGAASEQAYQQALRLHEQRMKRGTNKLDATIDASNSLYNLSNVAKTRGDSKAAIELSRRSLKLIEEAVAASPSDEEALEQKFLAQIALGTHLLEAGNMTEAEPILNACSVYAGEVLDSGKSVSVFQFTMLVGGLVNLGNLYAESSRFEESKKQNELGLQFANRLAEAAPDDPMAMRLLAGCHQSLAGLHQRMLLSQRGARQPAVPPETLIKEFFDHSQATKSILSELSDRDPYDLRVRAMLASQANACGHFYTLLRDWPKAQQELAEAEQLIDQLLKEVPDSIVYLETKAQIAGNQTGVYAELGDLKASKEKGVSVAETYKQLVSMSDSNRIYQVDLASAYGNLGHLGLLSADFTEAGAWADKSVAISLQNLKDIGKMPAIVQTLSNGYFCAATARTEKQEYSEALRIIDEALAHNFPANGNSYLAMKCRLLLELQRPKESLELLSASPSPEADPTASKLWTLSASRMLEIIDGMDQESFEQRAELENKVIERGVEAMRIALKLGSLRQQNIGKMKDLNRLRDTEAFKKQIAEPAGEQVLQ